jgi:hypothetical protein
MKGVKKMNTPGFTAEVSLHGTRAQYRLSTSALTTGESIFPQLIVRSFGTKGEAGKLCAEYAALANEAIDMGNSTSDPEGRAESFALAGLALSSGRAKLGCKFRAG